MKQALPPEVPARVRRVPFRTFALSVGASALAMACSFGEIDSENPGFEQIDPQTPGTENPIDLDDDATPGAGVDGDDFDTPPSTDEPVDSSMTDLDPENDPFDTEMGRQVRSILEVNCGSCHANGVASGGMDYIFSIDDLISNGKVVPGDKEDSQLFVRMQQQSMPPAFIRDQRPTFGQIETVGRWIDEMELPDPDGPCEAPDFLTVDEMIQAMATDISRIDVDDQPFTRYLTISYSSNAGDCGRSLQRQRYALFKGINSVSTDTQVHQPQAIDENELIYRIDIRDYNWDREIDLEDDGVVDFADAWLAILDGVGEYAIEYAGDSADDLKEDAQVNVPFLPVNAFIQASEFGDLYYSLIGANENLFDYELEVLGIDTVEEIADNNLMRAGFENSGVSKQERVLNRFDSGVAAGYSYWISFDFDGGNGNGDFNRANESIFADPLGFAFAGGEAIFNLPNGMQGYYVAAADGTRLNEAPVGVVIDPAQNNGIVTNGASCHSCHNAGLIDFRDTVKDYVIQNRVQFDNETYEDVLEQYPDYDEFKAAMDEDSQLHLQRTERAGVPIGTPDAISRVYLDFQLGMTAERVAGELQVPLEVLMDNLGSLDPQLGVLRDGAIIERQLFTNLYLDSLCVMQSPSENSPVGCP